MISKNFYKRWVGFDSEKDNIESMFPNQLRNTDEYFAEDTEIFYFRWNNSWIAINNKEQVQKLPVEINVNCIYEDIIDNGADVDIILNPNDDIKGIKDFKLRFTQSNDFVEVYYKDNSNIFLEGDYRSYFVKGNQIFITNDEGNGCYALIENVEFAENKTILRLPQNLECDIVGNLSIIQAYTLCVFDYILSKDKNKLIDSSMNNIIFSTNLQCKCDKGDSSLQVNDLDTSKYWNRDGYIPILLHDEEYYGLGNDNGEIKIFPQAQNDYQEDSYVNMVYKFDNIINKFKKNELVLTITNKTGVPRRFVLDWTLLTANFIK